MGIHGISWELATRQRAKAKIPGIYRVFGSRSGLEIGGRKMSFSAVLGK